MSLCASAKRHELNSWMYLTDVLTQLAARPVDVTNLLPDVWGKQHFPASYRWVVERTISWLDGFRKLRFVTEKTKDMQFAFLDLAVSMICFRFLNTSFC